MCLLNGYDYFSGNVDGAPKVNFALKIFEVRGKDLKSIIVFGEISKDSLKHGCHSNRISVCRDSGLFGTAYENSIHKQFQQEGRLNGWCGKDVNSLPTNSCSKLYEIAWSRRNWHTEFQD